MEIQGGKFLTFFWGQEVYGIPIKKVKEIIGNFQISKIPEAPGYIEGVFSLRGKIIPVLDLRLKFGIEAREDTARSCIIVIEISVFEEQRLVGFVVDLVSDVINIAKSEIEPPPEYEARIEGDFLTGLGKLKEKVILILNPEKILNQEELADLNQALNNGQQETYAS